MFVCVSVHLGVCVCVAVCVRECTLVHACNVSLLVHAWVWPCAGNQSPDPLAWRTAAHGSHTGGRPEARGLEAVPLSIWAQCPDFPLSLQSGRTAAPRRRVRTEPAAGPGRLCGWRRRSPDLRTGRRACLLSPRAGRRLWPSTVRSRPSPRNPWACVGLWPGCRCQEGVRPRGAPCFPAAGRDGTRPGPGLGLRPACHCAGLGGTQATVGARPPQLEPVVLSQPWVETWWAHAPRGCEGGCTSAAGGALEVVLRV